jgi:hypothetical protein
MQQSLVKKFVKTLVKKFVKTFIKRHKAFFPASSLHFKAGLCLSPKAAHFGLPEP